MYETSIWSRDERGVRGATSTPAGVSLSKRNTVVRTLVMGAGRRRCRRAHCADSRLRPRRRGLPVGLADRTNISSDSGKLIVRLTTIAGRASSAVWCIVNDEWWLRVAWDAAAIATHVAADAGTNQYINSIAPASRDCTKLCIAYTRIWTALRYA